MAHFPRAATRHAVGHAVGLAVVDTGVDGLPDGFAVVRVQDRVEHLGINLRVGRQPEEGLAAGVPADGTGG